MSVESTLKHALVLKLYEALDIVDNFYDPEGLLFPPISIAYEHINIALDALEDE